MYIVYFVLKYQLYVVCIFSVWSWCRRFPMASRLLQTSHTLTSLLHILSSRC